MAMSPNQKRVATWLAIGALVMAVAYLVSLWLTQSPPRIVDDPSSLDPQLKLNWKLALWFIQLGAAAKTIFATLLTVITAGIGAAAETYRHKAQILSIVILCLAGIGLCVLLLVGMGDPNLLGGLGFYSSFGTDAELKGAADIFFYGLIGWFSLFLATQLGLSVVKPEGWMNKLLGRKGNDEQPDEGSSDDQ